MIPRISYLDLVPGDEPIQTKERDSFIDGNVTPLELEIISRLVRFHDPQVSFEIGTFDGRTTLNLALHSRLDARVFTLDLPPSEVGKTALKLEVGEELFINKPRSGARFADSEVSHKITQLYGDSATYDFEKFVGTVDFLFIDGSHSYEYVIHDSMNALRLVRENGVILWHDYSYQGPTPWPGLTKALNELYASDDRFAAMKHIAGTAIVMLQLHGKEPNKTTIQREKFSGDSRQPEYLLASLEVEAERNAVPLGTPFHFKIKATNTGRVGWLPSNAVQGPVRLATRLLTSDGVWLNESYSRHNFPGHQMVLVGQTINCECSVPCPASPGKYILEMDLVSEGVAWFSRNGDTSVRVPIEVLGSKFNLMKSIRARITKGRGAQSDA
jgi:predicted O-methyltransferase YrrM